MTKNPHTSSDLSTGLPTLGDRPSEGSAASPRRTSRRIGRKAALLVGGAVAMATLGGAAAYAAGPLTQFSDVPAGHTFERNIAWMVDNDLTHGYPDGTFKPGSPITRGSAAAFFSNFNSSIEVVHATHSVTSQSAFSKSVTCPDGKRAVAGGGSLSAANTFITNSYPSGSKWTVVWETDNNTLVTDSQIQVQATCVPALELK